MEIKKIEMIWRLLSKKHQKFSILNAQELLCHWRDDECRKSMAKTKTAKFFAFLDKKFKKNSNRMILTKTNWLTAAFWAIYDGSSGPSTNVSVLWWLSSSEFQRTFSKSKHSQHFELKISQSTNLSRKNDVYFYWWVLWQRASLLIFLMSTSNSNTKMQIFLLRETLLLFFRETFAHASIPLNFHEDSILLGGSQV